ncbi:hypothetical protein GCM10023144_31020 [Pigmentiphaga soli]|uniref:Uncharacterized protein n=1 Tax=Pigmentiphaga soli TaxID=1007095 RepID=A0ABP8HAV6_9BURK
MIFPVAICGLISQYNLAVPDGLANVAAIVNRNVTVQGFRLSNYPSHRPAALADLKRLLRSGAVTNDETVVEGIENAPGAFISLFRGANIGKMLVRVGADD